MKTMGTFQDLIEEFKLRTVWWALCIFAVSYFLSHTSKSMWMNAPIAILFVSFLRILCNEIEFRRKAPLVHPQPYLAHLEKKQLSLNDSRLSSAPPSRKWKKKIDSPMVEAAMNDFVGKILKDFVVDLWYGDITPDREVPELMRAVVMEALAEIAARVRDVNLVDLLTKDIVDLIGEHLDLFRRNQAAIGVDVMETLSSDERDERLKYHLMSSKELHPALVSSESEYKVLQQLIGGVLAVVLKPREAQCPLVRSISRELVTCLVLQPIMNLACPGYINELIESVFLLITADKPKEVECEESKTVGGCHYDHSPSKDTLSPNNQKSDAKLDNVDNLKETYFSSNSTEEEPIPTRHSDWGRKLEAATQRRTEVLAPENLENLWTKGRNYKKKEEKKRKAAVAKVSSIETASQRKFRAETQRSNYGPSTETEERALLLLPPAPESQLDDVINKQHLISKNLDKASSFQDGHAEQAKDTTDISASESTNRLKKSNSTSNLAAPCDTEKTFTGLSSGPIITDFFTPKYTMHNEKPTSSSSSDIVLRNDRQNVLKLKSRVKGAYFEKLGSKSFAVYLIQVTDAEGRIWFVKRRYSNFEKLHRHLKDIPNYTLHLPPKRIFSSSTEDAFVHQRCIQLDKYLQDLLSIANVAEQHEVRDFLSVSSKNYSFGKSSSVMKTLAVNVDDAVDDIVRQFKGVSDGLMRKVVGPTSPSLEALSSVPRRNLSWNTEENNKQVLSNSTSESMNSLSDNEDGEKDGSHSNVEDGSNAQANGWHSDNELNSKSFPPRVVKHVNDSHILESGKSHDLEIKSERTSQGGFPVAINTSSASYLEDPVGVPPEWNPPNVTVPMLNLVDNLFQLKGRGWIRRQVFWISKQILQLVMEDAIDDWLLRQIHWLRKEETVAQGIRWIQDVLWPNGTFFIKLRDGPSQVDGNGGKSFQMANQMDGMKISKPGSFEEQLEAARRASDVKKMIYDGAPTAVVSLIGHKQYKRCARDIYYFIQSSVCIKQLAYSILELLLITIFPELRNLVIEVREKMCVQEPV